MWYLKDSTATNAWMVIHSKAGYGGHTGVLAAAIRAAETVDGCVGKILKSKVWRGVIITADHGNFENVDGEATSLAGTAVACAAYCVR
jgi:bisphosphoglycerate-independent phosphoglycerate mutase (AlkP superfamily)